MTGSARIPLLPTALRVTRSLVRTQTRPNRPVARPREVAHNSKRPPRIVGRMAGRPLHTFEVVRTERIAPHMTRVVLGGNGFDTFVPSEFTDSYVKLALVPAGVDVDALSRPLTLDSFDGLDTAHRPVVRTYT